METISAPTVAGVLFDRGHHAAQSNVANPTNSQAAPNVRYIRRDAADTSHQAATPPPAFVRQSPADAEAGAPLKYFSPFRLTRRA